MYVATHFSGRPTTVLNDISPPPHLLPHLVRPFLPAKLGDSNLRFVRTKKWLKRRRAAESAVTTSSHEKGDGEEKAAEGGKV